MRFNASQGNCKIVNGCDHNRLAISQAWRCDGVQAVRVKNLCGVLDRVQMPPRPDHLAIAFPFRALPDFAHPLGMVRVIVILMDGHDGGGNIHQFRAARPRTPKKIIVPGEAADGEREKPVAKAARINKIIDVIPRTLNVRARARALAWIRPSLPCETSSG